MNYFITHLNCANRKNTINNTKNGHDRTKTDDNSKNFIKSRKKITDKSKKRGKIKVYIIMDNTVSYLPFDRSDRDFAEHLVLSCGIPVHLKGFDLLVDCALAYADKPLPSAELYSLVGSFHAMTGHAVTRDISHALKRTRDLHLRLSELSGLPVCDNDIHNGFVVALLGKLVGRNKFFN